MQGHGETTGKYITFGYRESRDVHAALSYLKSRLPGKPIGVIGVSLGGAATLLGKEPIQTDAVILEAVYSSIERAIENRLAIRLGEFGRFLAPLLLW
jgi:predicted alpha/beta hydrolase